MEPMQFTKGEYTQIVQEKRKRFIHEHFGQILNTLFNSLREEADKMRLCHYEVSFDCPEHFNVDKIELILRDYFKDIGFESVSVPRKDEVTVIVLTLT